MKVTVCQLPDEPDLFVRYWEKLCDHTSAEHSELVLLPEMPFHSWLAATDQVDDRLWRAAVQAHENWENRLSELSASIVVGTRPIVVDGIRHNRGFVYHNGHIRYQHDKYFLPNENGFWEATWYKRGEMAFDPMQCGDVTLGFLICTELWFTEHARAYAKQGVHFVLNPRATEARTSDKWVMGGRAAAVMSGAYCLSANHCGEYDGVAFGGTGWIIDPDGEVLATTSDETPFVTVEVDLAVADAAKKTYPRDVLE